MSKSAWTRTPVSRPSASAPNVAVIRAGWRLVVDGHRLRPRIDRADRVVEQERGDRDQRLERQVELAAEPAAARARDDPHAVLGQPEDQRQLVAVHVRRLGGGEDLDAAVDDARRPGLGLDVGVLDVGGLERPGRRRGGRGQVGVDVAQPDEALDEDVPGRGLVEPGRGRVERGVDADQRRQRLPLDRQLVVGDGGHGRGVADERQHGLAAVADVALGEDRLVLAGRVDPEPVVARDVVGGQDADEARVAGEDRARGRRRGTAHGRVASGPPAGARRHRPAGRRRTARPR